MKKYILLLLLSFISMSIFSQDTNTTFFNNYYKLSLQFGVSRYTGAETTPLPSTLKYTFNDYTSPHFGFYYDVFQTNHFNFKIGFSTLLIRDVKEVKIEMSEIENRDRDYWKIIEFDGGNMWRFNLPITAEYIVQTGLGKMTINSSIIFGYHKEFGDTMLQTEATGFNGTELSTLNSVYGRKSAPWYANGQVGVGMYFPFKGWMLRTNVYYNLAFQKLYEGEFEFKNLQQSPDTSGKLSFKGNSFGVEFSIYLAKKKKKQ